jgi:hypothetical protein
MANVYAERRLAIGVVCALDTEVVGLARPRFDPGVG